jgi:hemoglobin
LEKTIDENFSGEIADSAKTKAENIANLMAYKMEIAKRTN